MTDILTSTDRTMLAVASGIDAAVIAERGYRSLTALEAAKVLPPLRFSALQSRLGSGLLFPLTVPDDPAPLYQFRPDRPRSDADGQAIKYEIPDKCPPAAYSPPARPGGLRSDTTPLYLTEGAKKVDSLLSRGATALGGIGVWSFTVPRTAAEKTRCAQGALARLARVTLQGGVVIVFDSDAAFNTDVERAEAELGTLLRAQGAAAGAPAECRRGEQARRG